MKYDPNESYDRWLERVRMNELGIAYRRIANGADVPQVIREMSENIINKGLHPIYKKLMK
jgi:glutamyl-tRNA reductase